MENEETKTEEEVVEETAEESEEEEFDYNKEIERLEEKKASKYSPLEKATFSAKKIADEIAKLGGDPKKIFGASSDEEETNSNAFKINSVEDLTGMIEKIVEGKVGNVKSTFAQAELGSRIAKLSKNDNEKKVIQYVFENVIQQTGDMDEDVENAYIIANKNRSKEIFKALTGKEKNRDGKVLAIGGSQKRTEKVTRNKVSAQEEQFAKNKGLVWSEEDGRFVSPARKKHAESIKK